MWAIFLATTSYILLCVMYAITLEFWTDKVRNMILPIVTICIVIAVIFRPEDEDTWIKVLHLHFFLSTIRNEAAIALSEFREGYDGQG